jgi:hypothetical protein
VRDYVELLASAYLLLVVHYWRSDSDSEELSKDKKLYFGDPARIPDRPVVIATKDKLERRGGYVLIPASLLLWALSG